jgi:hypothetical protein
MKARLELVDDYCDALDAAAVQAYASGLARDDIMYASLCHIIAAYADVGEPLSRVEQLTREAYEERKQHLQRST